MRNTPAWIINPSKSHLMIYESNLLKKGIEYIAGVDEVGRGALAGPMVVASVILNPIHLKLLADIFVGREIHTNNDIASGILEKYNQIRDSKLLLSAKREELSIFIKNNAVAYSIEIVDNTTIDDIGVSKCTQIGFFNAISKLSVKAEHILTDLFPIKVIKKRIQTNIVKGDNKSISIASASIIAKVFRDDLITKMYESREEYKPYLFNKNKAYGTQEHLKALYKFGPCDIHRKSFEPVKSMVGIKRDKKSM